MRIKYDTTLISITLWDAFHRRSRLSTQCVASSSLFFLCIIIDLKAINMPQYTPFYLHYSYRCIENYPANCIWLLIAKWNEFVGLFTPLCWCFSFFFQFWYWCWCFGSKYPVKTGLNLFTPNRPLHKFRSMFLQTISILWTESYEQKEENTTNKILSLFLHELDSTTRTDIWPIEKVYWRKGKSDSIRFGLFEAKERKKNLIRNRNM